MVYNPATDFIALFRTITGGVSKAEMPGLDFVVAALGRSGLINVTVSGTAPIANQSTTAWFQPASPSYTAEGALFLWNAAASAYQPATAALFRQFLEASFGASGVSWFSGTGGAPSNTIGNNNDFFIRTDSPGGIYGPKAAGAWPVQPLPGTSFSQVSSALDYAFGNPPQGSVLFRGASVWQTLAPGASGQTLTSNGAGSNPSWTSLSNTVNSAALDTSFGSAVGNMLYRNVSNWTSLGIGANGTVLSSNGTTPQWSTLSAALDTAFGSSRGSLITRGASGWQVLAPGASAGLVLTSGTPGADVSWQPGSAGGVNSAALDSAFGTAVGGVLMRSTGGWVNMGAGTAGFFLQAGGAGANATWAAVGAPTVAVPYPVGTIMTALDGSSTWALSPLGVGATTTFATGGSAGVNGKLYLSTNGASSGGIGATPPGTWKILGYCGSSLDPNTTNAALSCLVQRVS